ncbi:DUF3105 domain-containing protein [Glycomyces sp. L485]|uniref:DUF3105 domain-containing protein n=1 Tax=Glycomyces sp. L485 TaxID=2909235 RepID=UPI001F4B4E91|nr:DUF3105 domain-containing protein [Glycomyces sp. L485]MCH7231414.1 DUF3105 domain-containing protein [Glycomyces sp. L485]
MTTARTRFAALAGTALIAAGCSTDGSGSEDPELATTQSEVEGVENFYGEFGDYATVTAAIRDGEVAEEDLEHPWVVQQDHVDASAGWDGEPPVYEMTPPAGGDHLSAWQTCDGAVYDGPIVDGNAVHSLEHGAVWLTYDPELVDAPQVAALSEKISGRDYSLMSPYPGQGVAVSLQSWGNRYQTDDAEDPKIDDYLDVYILNEAFNPETMATCSGGLATLAE